uniref:BTB domain-containing protein n=1 Tax=Syphacia muris TaxID=451379 RepID=A0A158R4B3_9BILA
MSKQITRVKTFKATLEWKIENFSEKRCLFEKNRPLRSTKFGCAGIDFEMSLYDSGMSNSRQCFFCLHHCSCSYSIIRAICNIFVQGCGNAELASNRISVIHAKIDILKDVRELDPVDLNKISSSPFFTVFCEIEFCPQGYADPEQEPIFHSINGEGKSVARSNLEILESGICSDCVFKVGEEEVKAHRCFLTQHSEVFRAMFNQETMLEAECGIIEIKDFGYESVKAMLEYIYCGSTAKVTCHVEEVLSLAEKYAIKPLKEFCGLYLGSKINATNLAQTAQLADMYCSTPLLKKCARYLSENRTSILRSKDWENFKKKTPELAIRLLELSL